MTKMRENPERVLWSEKDQGIQCQGAPRALHQLTPGMAHQFWAAFPVCHLLIHKPQVLPYFTVLYNLLIATLLVNALQNTGVGQGQSYTAASVFWKQACRCYWNTEEAKKQKEKQIKKKIQTLRNKTYSNLTSVSLWQYLVQVSDCLFFLHEGPGGSSPPHFSKLSKLFPHKSLLSNRLKGL